MLDHQDLNAVQEAAQAAVDEALGSQAGGSAAIQSIEHWGGGAHNSGYKLALENERQGRFQLFMKIEKEHIFPRTRRCQIEREVYGICLAKQAGMDVPVLLGCDFSGRTAGCRYLLEEFIDRDLLGEALESLAEEQRASLLAEFERKASQISTIRGDIFGELYPGGWLGQFDSWRAMLGAFSTILLEDAETLGHYSAAELARIRAAHARALDTIRYEGPAVLTHNDLHIWNAFVEPDHGALKVGKLFDFGLSLFQAEYLACFGQFGFNGKEAEIARRYPVSEAELRGYALISGLEFVNFAGEIKFAPEQAYGYVAREREYLLSCP